MVDILILMAVKKHLNMIKTNIYLFTSKIERISLGNIISFAFISGFTISSILTLISKNNSQESVRDYLTNDNDEIEEAVKENFRQELEYDRPPERDIRESQPTISVNYRFVDQDNNSYSSKKTTNNPNNKDNDWVNFDNEW